MNGVPQDIDLSFFVDLTLMQVCVGEYELILNFSEHVSVLVQGNFEIVPIFTVSGVSKRLSDILAVLSLLGMKTVGVKRDGSHTLILEFSGGRCLLLHDNSPSYESFVITTPHTTIVV